MIRKTLLLCLVMVGLSGAGLFAAQKMAVVSGTDAKFAVTLDQEKTWLCNLCNKEIAMKHVSYQITCNKCSVLKHQHIRCMRECDTKKNPSCAYCKVQNAAVYTPVQYRAVIVKTPRAMVMAAIRHNSPELIRDLVHCAGVQITTDDFVLAASFKKPQTMVKTLASLLAEQEYCAGWMNAMEKMSTSK